MSIVITGHSDDNVEIDGDVVEEIPTDDAYLAFSNGVVLHVTLPGEDWAIQVHAAPPTSADGPPPVTIETAHERRAAGEDDAYSDRATVEGATWVLATRNEDGPAVQFLRARD